MAKIEFFCCNKKSDYISLSEKSEQENVSNLFELMRVKLNLNLSQVNLDEFFEQNLEPNKLNVLAILDKLYSLFKNHQFLGLLINHLLNTKIFSK